jgi:hypothetical protein
MSFQGQDKKKAEPNVREKWKKRKGNGKIQVSKVKYAQKRDKKGKRRNE